MTAVVWALFPGLIVLRLSGSNQPHMDKLYYYVRRLDECLQKSKTMLDELQKGVNNNRTQNTYKHTLVACLINHDIDLEEDDESDVDGIVNHSFSEGSDSESSTHNSKSLGDAFLACWEHQKKKIGT